MQGLSYHVDIVLVIDATGSMSPIIDRVKDRALRFYDDLSKSMSEKGKGITALRLRVIAYRDYYYDGDRSMIESPFFELPQDKENFSKFVNAIYADGGGDEPENGLEALSLAINSKWSVSGDRRRQIIVIWTDASVHPLEKSAGSKPGAYPSSMPKNLDELTNLWEGQGQMNSSAKRLIVYAPDAYAWTDLCNYWTNSLHFASAAGEGLSDFDYTEILNAIANSV